MARDIERVHASFGSVNDLLDRRRAIYRSSLELADLRMDQAELPVDVLDNPVVRAHLGEVLSGTSAYDPAEIRSMASLTSAVGQTLVFGYPVRVASAAEAAGALARALQHIEAELSRHESVASTALVLDTSPSYEGVRQMVVEGIELAVDVASDLASDLLPHVALFAVLSSGSAGRLGSASVREYPGLILIPEPRSQLEVAEALVHEGAHQKFFDLVLTRSILGPLTSTRFRPPWAGDRSPAWPFDQCLAAFHAYCCLDAFWARLHGNGGIALHDHSLLPLAAERAQILGNWLMNYGELLGPDGQRLVGSLAERNFDTPAFTLHADQIVGKLASSAQPTALRGFGDSTLVVQLTSPALVMWVPSEVTAALP
jgi:hypothetical protein